MHLAPLKQNAGRRYGQEITHSESPLDSLVRKTSSKRLQNPSSRTQPLVWEPYRPSRPQPPQQVSSSSAHSSSPGSGIANSSSQKQQQPNLHLNIEHANRFPNSNALHSPLLHSHFPGRDSVASGSYCDDSFDGGSYIDPTPYDGIYEQQYHHHHHHHHHHPHQETDMSHGMDAKSTTSFDGRSDVIDLYFYQQDDDSGKGGEREDASNVVVSSPDDNNDSGVRGRAPVVKPVMANFSKPMRDSGQWRQADAVAEKVTPQLPADMQEQKKVVLERNAPRTQAHASTGSVHNSYRPSPLSKHMTTVPVAHPAAALQLGPYHNYNDGRPSQSAATGSTLQPPPMSDMQRRSGSPSSVYSNYSYYQYDGLIPSPVGNTPEQSLTVKGSTSRGQSPVGSREPTTANATAASNGPPTPQDYLQLGIDHHQANRLQESVRCFEQSAKEGGGCGFGMLMYGLSLRHGWGCTKNEALGFKWVRKAAESAVDDLEKLRTDKTAVEQSSAVPAELVLAIYEVGQCFFHGWGVAKNQKMGVSYYIVAARLGDCDAQEDLAFCLANGKGCKKNKKDAARWYRTAVKQGLSDVGLAWIYKEKYQ